MARAKVTGKKPSRAARSQKLDTLWQFSDLVANLQAMGGAAKEMALRILAALRVTYNQAKENKILQENPADMQNVKSRYFHKCLERVGLRRIQFHDLRHTLASLVIENGESLTYVKGQMGHASIKITVDTYGHLVPGANPRAERA